MADHNIICPHCGDNEPIVTWPFNEVPITPKLDGDLQKVKSYHEKPFSVTFTCTNCSKRFYQDFKLVPINCFPTKKRKIPRSSTIYNILLVCFFEMLKSDAYLAFDDYLDKGKKRLYDCGMKDWEHYAMYDHIHFNFCYFKEKYL